MSDFLHTFRSNKNLNDTVNTHNLCCQIRNCDCSFRIRTVLQAPLTEGRAQGNAAHTVAPLTAAWSPHISNALIPPLLWNHFDVTSVSLQYQVPNWSQTPSVELFYLPSRMLSKLLDEPPAATSRRRTRPVAPRAPLTSSVRERFTPPSPSRRPSFPHRGSSLPPGQHWGRRPAPTLHRSAAPAGSER